MFIRKQPRRADQERTVVLTLKTSNLHQFNPVAGDRITEIACVELLNGELSGRTYGHFVYPGDPNLPGLFLECAKHYRSNLKDDAANELIHHIQHAMTFKQSEQNLLEFLGDPSTTTILVHYKKGILDFLRNELSQEGNATLAKFTMEDMISRAAKLSHEGHYHGGRYPDMIDTNKEKIAPTRSFYKFNDICSELKVSTRRRTGYSASQDADMLARAEHNRQSLVNANKRHQANSPTGMRK